MLVLHSVMDYVSVVRQFFMAFISSGYRRYSLLLNDREVGSHACTGSVATSSSSRPICLSPLIS